MSGVLWPALYLSMSLGVVMMMIYIPLKAQLRVSGTLVILIHGILLVAKVAALAFFAVGERTYEAILGLFIPLVLLDFLMPFFLIRRCFWQALFLFTLSLNWALVAMGAASFAEIQLHGLLPGAPVFSRSFIMVTCLAMITQPFILPFLSRVMAQWLASRRSPIWRVIWVIPLVFFVLCMATGNVLSTPYIENEALFIIVRFIAVGGMALVLYLLVQALSQQAKDDAIQENARTMEQRLYFLDKQYAWLARDTMAFRMLRHDLRHHINLIGDYAARGDREAIQGYLGSLEESLPKDDERPREEALLALLDYYKTQGEEKGIALSVAGEPCRDMESIEELDLCVMLGNALEWAMDSCAKNGAKTIRCVFFEAEKAPCLRVIWQGEGENDFLHPLVAGLVGRCGGRVSLSRDGGDTELLIQLPG